jgi:hypothetical protein
MVWEVVHWIHLVQDRDHWWTVVDMVVNFLVPLKVWSFLTSWMTITFPRRALLRVVGWSVTRLKLTALWIHVFKWGRMVFYKPLNQKEMCKEWTILHTNWNWPMQELCTVLSLVVHASLFILEICYKMVNIKRCIFFVIMWQWINTVIIESKGSTLPIPKPATDMILIYFCSPPILTSQFSKIHLNVIHLLIFGLPSGCFLVSLIVVT